MSERNEKLSAFIDDALHSDELMSFSLSAEAEDARVVQRYQMVGDALRGEVSESSFIDVSVAVREALADENIADEAAAARPARDDMADESRVGSPGGLWDSLFGAWLKPVGGMAVAATVAIVLVSTLSQPESGVDGVANPYVADKGVADGFRTAVRTAPVQTMPAQAVRTVPVSSNVTSPVELNPYLNQHLNHVPSSAVQGRLPYARSAIYGSQQTIRVGDDSLQGIPEDSLKLQTQP